MLIGDATPGDVLRDADGNVWYRTKRRAAMLTINGEMISDKAPLRVLPLTKAAAYSPFVRLIPEPPA